MQNSFLDNAIKERLRACQLRQLELLIAFHSICVAHNLTYWLDGGTLLGAVRHDGFIPWDDDIDVAMPTVHYQKLLKLPSAILPAGTFLQTKLSDPNYPNNFAKLMCCNSLLLSRGDNLSADYQKGIYIDIFEFVNYPTVPRAWIKPLATSICRAQYALCTPQTLSAFSSIKYLNSRIKILALSALWRSMALAPQDRYISNTIADNGYGIMHEKSRIFPVNSIKFEGHYFFCPSNSDFYLRELYGDYMKIPAQRDQKTHAYYIDTHLVDSS